MRLLPQRHTQNDTEVPGLPWFPPSGEYHGEVPEMRQMPQQRSRSEQLGLNRGQANERVGINKATVIGFKGNSGSSIKKTAFIGDKRSEGIRINKTAFLSICPLTILKNHGIICSVFVVLSILSLNNVHFQWGDTHQSYMKKEER
jgi:hypothetical protein